MGEKRKRVYEAMVDGATEGLSGDQLFSYIRERCPKVTSKKLVRSALLALTDDDITDRNILDTIYALAIKHRVDTGGVSDISFALCHLVGFQLVPRLRGLKDRKLYLFPGDTPPENLASLVGEPINIERIKANWNDILRLVTTIRSGQVRPSTLLAKLSAFPRQNGLALALRDIGRINRSIFLPQWWQNPEMRRNATAGLNKSEAQNTLARALFFNRLGELRDRTFESQFYRASGLNLLINAIVYWNTLYLEPTFAQLNREGIATPPDVIKHITPLGWQHISLTGDYIWTPTDSPDLRPLRRETSFLAA